MARRIWGWSVAGLRAAGLLALPWTLRHRATWPLAIIAGVTSPSSPPNSVDIGAITSRFGSSTPRRRSGVNRLG